MNLLLDTHALLWWLEDSGRLPAAARETISDERNLVTVSAASAWEMAIKRRAGKLDIPDELPQVLAEQDMQPLAVTVEHAVAAGSLPLHHRDPFDRMLVAQAQLEGLTIVSGDMSIARYGVAVLWK